MTAKSEGEQDKRRTLSKRTITIFPPRAMARRCERLLLFNTSGKILRRAPPVLVSENGICRIGG
jgi:hypothetical protein